MTTLYTSNDGSVGFDVAGVGSLPANWAQKVGTWQTGTVSPQHGHTHSFGSTTQADGDVAIISGIAAAADMDLVIDQRLNGTGSGGTHFQSVGLVVRSDGAYQNCYTVIASASGQSSVNLLIFKRMSGSYSQIAQGAVSGVPLTVGHTLRLRGQAVPRHHDPREGMGCDGRRRTGRVDCFSHRQQRDGRGLRRPLLRPRCRHRGRDGRGRRHRLQPDQQLRHRGYARGADHRHVIHANRNLWRHRAGRDGRILRRRHQLERAPRLCGREQHLVGHGDRARFRGRLHRAGARSQQRGRNEFERNIQHRRGRDRRGQYTGDADRGQQLHVRRKLRGGTAGGARLPVRQRGWSAAGAPTIGGGAWSFAITAPAAGTHTLSVRDHNNTAIVGTSGSFVTTSGASVAPNNSALLYSALNWNVTSGSAITINAGAWFRILFTGTSISAPPTCAHRRARSGGASITGR